MDSTEDAIPSEVFIEVGFTCNTCGPCHVVNNLVDSFHHSIGLWVVSGNELALNTVMVVDSVLHFGSKFFAMVHDDFSWPWIARELLKLKVVCNAIGSAIRDFSDLVPSGCGINHGEAVKFDFVVFLAKGVGTNQVDT